MYGLHQDRSMVSLWQRQMAWQETVHFDGTAAQRNLKVTPSVGVIGDAVYKGVSAWGNKHQGRGPVICGEVHICSAKRGPQM